MEIKKVYQAERALLTRKFPTLGFTWETRELIEQLVSPLLENNDAQFIYKKLKEGLKAKAKSQIDQLAHCIEVDKRRALCRIVISIPILRECFSDELTEHDEGGSGGAKNRVNPAPRFGKF